MARNKGPRKVQQCGVAGSSFLDDHAASEFKALPQKAKAWWEAP